MKSKRSIFKKFPHVKKHLRRRGMTRQRVTSQFFYVPRGLSIHVLDCSLLSFITYSSAYLEKEYALCAKAENEVSVKTIGLIVNPVAGMGGAVGLKGTDGRAILKKAVSLGAKPIAPARAESFLSELHLAVDRFRLIVGAGAMGEEEARDCGFDCV